MMSSKKKLKKRLRKADAKNRKYLDDLMYITDPKSEATNRYLNICVKYQSLKKIQHLLLYGEPSGGQIDGMIDKLKE